MSEVVDPVSLILAPDGDEVAAGDKPAIGEEMVWVVFAGGPVPSAVAAVGAFLFSDWPAMVEVNCAIVEGPTAAVMVEALDTLSVVIVFADSELSTMASELVEIVTADGPASGIVDSTGPAMVTPDGSFIVLESVFNSDLSSASSRSL